MINGIENMKSRDLEALILKASKKLAKEKNILDIAENIIHILKMNKNKNSTIKEILSQESKFSDAEFKHLGKYALLLAGGKAVRMPSLEFPWTKKVLIQLSRAVQYTNNFMYNLSSLAPEKQQKLSSMVSAYDEIESLSKKIIKAAHVKQKKSDIPMNKKRKLNKAEVKIDRSSKEIKG